MGWIHHIKIKYKMFGLLVFMMLCLTIITFASYSNLQKSSQKMDAMYNDQLLPIKNMDEARIHHRAIETDILQLLAGTVDEKKKADIMKDMEDRDTKIQNLLKTLDGRIPDKDFKAVEDKINVLNTQRGKIIYAAINGKLDDAKMLYGTMNKQIQDINDTLNKIADDKTAIADQVNTNNHKDTQKSTIFMLCLSLICMLLSAFVGWWISELISAPIGRAVKITGEVARGNLNVTQLPVRGRDEVGLLSLAINEMVQQLQTIITQVSDSADRVAQSADGMLKHAENSTESGELTSTAILGIHQGFVQQLTSIQELSVAMEEMTNGAQQIATENEAVTAASQHAHTTAESGKSVIGHALHTIESLTGGVKESAERIQHLGARVKSIDTVIAFISSIAKQTNLLSLNASIEASRAGEHGRGFAVVAQEIRNLAEESSKSAVQVSDAIQDIQIETMNLVKQIMRSADDAQAGLQSVQEAGESFDGIAEQIGIVSKQMLSISAIVEQMSAGSEEVLASVQSLGYIADISSKRSEEVTDATQQSLAAIKEVRSSSLALHELSGELKGRISQFQS